MQLVGSNEPRYDGTPDEQSRFNSEEQPKESVISLSYAVAEPRTVVVESTNTAPTCVAMLCSQRLSQPTDTAISVTRSMLFNRFLLHWQTQL